MGTKMDVEYIFSGVIMKRLLSGEESGGRLCLFESSSEGASQTPIHVHANEDETIHMRHGDMQVIVAGKAHTLHAGDTFFLPRGIPHQLMNVSGEPSSYLLVCTPAGFDAFVEAAGRPRAAGEPAAPPTPNEIALLKEAAPKFGITLLPGW